MNTARQHDIIGLQIYSSKKPYKETGLVQSNERLSNSKGPTSFDKPQTFKAVGSWIHRLEVIILITKIGRNLKMVVTTLDHLIFITSWPPLSSNHWKKITFYNLTNKIRLLVLKNGQIS